MTGRRPTFVLTIDFEDWHQLVFRRLGRPNWREGSAEFERYLSVNLDLLDELGVSATFFVAGVAAERHPRALEDVASRGHEIACHGYEHVRVFQQGPDEFRRDLERCIDTVERICGVTPIGFRAPWFSVTRDSRWAYDTLRELGFRYDSSLYDTPFVPRRIEPIPTHPFLVRDGLWEFPVAVWRWRNGALPLGGGAYWRALPAPVLWRGLEAAARRSPSPVLYFHPYEFADGPLRVVLPATATPRARTKETARRLYKNARRDLIRTRLREAADRFRFVPFRDIVGEGRDDLDTTLLPEARALV